MSDILLIVSFLSPLLIFLRIVLTLVRSKNTRRKSICIVVLGDLGRSPRMQYHAQSFLNEDYLVDLVAYPGSAPLDALTKSPAVRIHYLHPLPTFSNLEIPRFLLYVIKTIWQAVDLLWILLRNVRANGLLLQNPPAVPAVPVCWFFCRLSSSEFLLDWHNYAHSIMALTLGWQHVLVKATRLIESYFGRKADKNFCVTLAMKNDLQDKWGIKARVLYDRPPKEFRRISLKEKHELLMKLSGKYEDFGAEDGNGSRFTEKLPSGEIKLKEKRPGLVISSTSWTEDEDFSILCNALSEYELACSSDIGDFPDLICAITGKGPLKEFWNEIIKLKKWQHVKVITPWLENEDYPKLLASADLGVCLHTSSSGLDLPMKVVDMFGCGLPVAAYNFKCLEELVRHDENGFCFSNDKELSQQLQDWFKNFPTNKKQIETEKRFREELIKFQEVRWHGNWSSVVLPSLNY